MSKIYDNVLEKISNSRKVFVPNLTSKLSFLAACENLQKDAKFLDLGCGNGILGIALYKSKKINKIFSSDVSNFAVNNAKKNYKKFKIKNEIKVGNLFEPWKGKKFDYILNDVSAISSLVANRSKWFNNNIPCKAGKDGTNLTIQILKKSKSFLNADGKLQIPILSLSNKKKIIYAAKKNFNKVKSSFSQKWFLPNEMMKIKKNLESYKIKGYIKYDYKFNKIICETEIIICEKPK